MEYEIMKTAFYDVCKSADVDFLLADFAENITWAELYLASAMDLKVLPNLTKVSSSDVDATNTRSIDAPSDMLKLESVRMALSRDEDTDEPIYLQSTIVEPSEFLAKVQHSSDILASLFNGMINVNPDPAAAVSGESGSIEIVYKRKPTVYMSSSSIAFNGALVATLDKESSSGLYSTTTVAQTLEDIGLNEENMNPGKVVFDYSSGTIIFGTIVSAWTVGTVSYIKIGNDTFYPPGDLSNVYIAEGLPIGGSSVSYRDDGDEPDFSTQWHTVILDLGIARMLMGKKPEIAKMHIEMAYLALQRYGVELPFIRGGTND